MAKTSRLYLAAVLCGVIPLALGIGIYVLWLWTAWDWLMYAGMATVVNGTLAVLAGLICLAAYRAGARARGDAPATLRSAIATVLLLINFPTALGIIVAVMDEHLTTRLVVINQGPTIDRFVLTGACDRLDFGPIPTGKTDKRDIHVLYDGNLEFQAWRGGDEIRGEVLNYVTPGEGSDVMVTFAADGSWWAKERFRRLRR